MNNIKLLEDEKSIINANDTSEKSSDSLLSKWVDKIWDNVCIQKQTGWTRFVSSISSNHTIKGRFRKVTRLLSDMQINFYKNEAGVNVDKLIEKKLNIFKRKDRQSKSVVMGLIPFCEKFKNEITVDYEIACELYNKMITAAQEDTKSNNKIGESVTYTSFSKALKNKLNESEESNNISAIDFNKVGPNLIVRDGQFCLKGDDSDMVIQVTSKSTREMCYIILNNFFDKYIDFQTLGEKTLSEINDIDDINDETIAKYKKLISLYATPNEKDMVKMFTRIEKQFRNMCNHYYSMGNAFIRNFKKYTKIENGNEKQDNRLAVSYEKLSSLWDNQKDVLEHAFSYIINEIINSSKYKDYVNFIADKVLPILKTGFAGDADYVLNVMPKEGDYYIVSQTGKNKNTGNNAIIKITKNFDEENKTLDFDNIGLIKCELELNSDGSYKIKNLKDLNNIVYTNKKYQNIKYSTFLSLDPRYISNFDAVNNYTGIAPEKFESGEMRATSLDEVKKIDSNAYTAVTKWIDNNTNIKDRKNAYALMQVVNNKLYKIVAVGGDLIIIDDNQNDKGVIDMGYVEVVEPNIKNNNDSDSKQNSNNEPDKTEDNDSEPNEKNNNDEQKTVYLLGDKNEEIDVNNKNSQQFSSQKVEHFNENSENKDDKEDNKNENSDNTLRGLYINLGENQDVLIVGFEKKKTEYLAEYNGFKICTIFNNEVLKVEKYYIEDNKDINPLNVLKSKTFTDNNGNEINFKEVVDFNKLNSKYLTYWFDRLINDKIGKEEKYKWVKEEDINSKVQTFLNDNTSEKSNKDEEIVSEFKKYCSALLSGITFPNEQESKQGEVKKQGEEEVQSNNITSNSQKSNNTDEINNQEKDKSENVDISKKSVNLITELDGVFQPDDRYKQSNNITNNYTNIKSEPIEISKDLIEEFSKHQIEIKLENNSLWITFKRFEIDYKEEKKIPISCRIRFIKKTENLNDYTLLMTARKNTEITICSYRHNDDKQRNQAGYRLAEYILWSWKDVNNVIIDTETNKKEVLNSSVQESIKFNIQYNINNKIIESAAFNTGINRKITSDKDSSKYYIFSECVWSTGNDMITKKTLANKIKGILRTRNNKIDLLEYAKANDNVQMSNIFENMNYFVKNPGNLYSIVGCSLYECAVAVKFNNNGVISNVIPIGITKIN